MTTGRKLHSTAVILTGFYQLYFTHIHESKISHSLRKPSIEKTQQLEKANRQKHGQMAKLRGKCAPVLPFFVSNDFFSLLQVLQVSSI
jgi:hypothetical protein